MIERPFNAAALCETARKLAGKLEADVARNINEATTIEKYVNPVLEELGWRLEDDRRVAQFAVQGKGAVDIALLVSGEPQVLVEAKRLRQGLDLEEKESQQALEYAFHLGKEWCVLTNGDQFQVYWAHASLKSSERKVVEFSLTGLAKEREEDLRSAWLLSYEAVTTRELERHAGHVLAAHALRRILDKPSEELLFFLENSMGKIGITREALRAALDLASRGLRPEEVLRWALQSGSEARPPVTPAPKSPGGQQFKWEVNFADDGTFTLHCHYLPDESRSFTVTGKRVGPDGDFRRARKALLDQITTRIRPLFPALDSTHIVAKAWSGVHRVYPSEVYGRK